MSKILDALDSDIKMYGIILNRINKILIEINRNEINMSSEDISKKLEGLDFGCVERIMKSNSNLSKLLTSGIKNQIFDFFRLIQRNGNPIQIKSHIQSVIVQKFKEIYNSSRDVIGFENGSRIIEFKKIPEFDEFLKKTA